MTLVTLSTETSEEAGRLVPATTRSLDAMHLATALRLGSDLDAVVACDDRVADTTHLDRTSAAAPAGGNGERDLDDVVLSGDEECDHQTREHRLCQWPLA